MSGTILDKVRHTMKTESIDALIASSPENVSYTAGYQVPSQVIPIRKRQFAAVVTADRAALIVVNTEEAEAKQSSVLKDIRRYEDRAVYDLEFSPGPMELAADCLREFGVAQGRLGVEMDFMPARYFERLRTNLPAARFFDAERTFEHMRMTKTAEEVTLLRRIGGIVDRVHREVYAAAKLGMTEKDMARMITDGLLRAGADGVNRLVIGSGERSTYANATPSDRPLRRGDIVRVDIFANSRGYMSDIARTVVVGQPNAEQREVWRKLVETEDAVLSVMRPGARTPDIMNTYTQTFKKFGLDPFINFLGHGIGLTLHEDPYISRTMNVTLEEGMVLCIEPLYWSNDAGFHLEDEVIITSKGYELISDGRNRGRLIELG